MTTARHETFTVESRVGAPPRLVFTAFAEPERRRRRLRMPGSGARYEDDFRVGGVEVARRTVRLPEGEQRLLDTAVHLAIEPGRRTVWAYTAAVDDVERWAPLVTVELEPIDDGTLLRWTEQVAFLVASGARRTTSSTCAVRSGSGRTASPPRWTSDLASPIAQVVTPGGACHR